MLVTILTHVFDPPPDVLALPWVFIGELALALVAGAVVSAVVVLFSVRRADVSRALREG
jgi:putative ABC transport system permease protein